MRKTSLEVNSSIFLCSFPLFMGVGLSNMIKTMGADVWISVIIGSALGFFINFIMTKLPKEENKIFSLIYSFLILLLDIMILTKLISSIYLYLTPNIIIMIPMVILLLWTSKKGYTTIYKASSLLIIFYGLLFLVAATSLIPTIKIDYFFPLLTHNLKDILICALDFALISTLPFTAIPDFKENYSYKTYLFSSLVLFIIFIAIIGNLNPDLAAIYRYPEYMIFKNISILNFIENIENILFFIWIINIFVSSSFCSIKIKEIIKPFGLLIIFIINAFLINYVFLDNYKIINFIFRNFRYILIAIFIIFLLSKLLARKKQTN